MSAPLGSQGAGLELAGAAREPAWVRNGSAQVQQDYKVALGFEQMLVEQLAGALRPSEAEAESQEGGDAAGGMLSSLLPQALAQGVVGGGGLGLAAQLTREMQPLGGAARPAAGGGTAS